MVRSLRSFARVLIACSALAACGMPPPDEVISRASGPAERLDLGKNQAGEACSLVRGDQVAQIYCGAYEEPAGRVLTPTQVTADPVSYITSSLWRDGFDRRYRCGQTERTTVLDSPAGKLTCTWRDGGWGQVALATRIGDTLYVADGIAPAESVLPRAIGVLSGRIPAVRVAADVTGEQARQEAEQALNLEGAGAIEAVHRQIERGALENRQGNYAAAEAAYRAAVTIQERKLGVNNPALAVPLAREALQISNQGRFAESDKLFARAQRLATAREQADPVAQPMVLHLRALDQLNRQKRQNAEAALHLLDQAEAGFRALVPPEALVARRHSASGGRSAAEQMADAAATSALLADQSAANALNGLIETRRYKAVALKYLGRTQEAVAALTASRDLYQGRDPRLQARYFRSVGVIAAAAGQESKAISDLDDAVTTFTKAQNGSRPLAETQLLLAANLMERHDYGEALDTCRDAVGILLSLKAGISGRLIVPCLDAYAHAADRGGSDAPAIRAEMFAAAQLAQGSITSQQIARATARMAAGAGNPRAAEAIRARDTAIAKLDGLYRRRAELAADRDKATQVASLDHEIEDAQAERQRAGQALQAASPGFAQLVQESVTADDAEKLLQPNEALVAIVLGEKDGWTLLMRRDRIVAGRIDGGAKKVDALVKRFRASMEVGPDGNPPAFDGAAALGLYKAVLAPVAAGLDGVESLTVAPSGSLLSVPFGALLTGEVPMDGFQHAPFLIRRMAISHVPSVASFVNLRKAAHTVRATQPWFGLGDPRPPTPIQAQRTYPVDACGDTASLLAGLQPLPGSRRELEAARGLLGGDASDVMLGAAFTAQNVLATPLQNYKVLHFATHALLPGELRCQSEPAIVTSTAPNAPDASGAMLTASEIEEGLKLDAQLVILAACNTGGANGEAGESLSGLARSFLFAGARSLLVTHWEANDATTTYLTALFLQNWQTHPDTGPAMALANAQRLMLDKAEGGLANLGHPFYWAVAALIGGEGPTGSARMAAAPAGRPHG
jgi:CHAT domain-containing protein